MHMAHQYALILMDINMPVMDGCEATKIIRQKCAGEDGPYIVAVSAQNPENNFSEIGFDEWVVKPITQNKLKELVEFLI